MTRWSLLLIAPLLNGCALASAVQERDMMSKLDAERHACRSAPGTYLQKARCMEAAENRLGFDRYHPPDLVRVMQTQRALIFAKLDRGEISSEQADAEIATMLAQVIGEEHRRGTSSAIAAGANRSITCRRIGDTVQCD